MVSSYPRRVQQEDIQNKVCNMVFYWANNAEEYTRSVQRIAQHANRECGIVDRV